ncbi:MAG: tetratricopeptide repeat protein [Spirochaetales bacterium]|nr:tetratricopeptide repeat protein [Spirochaetales bacterium]
MFENAQKMMKGKRYDLALRELKMLDDDPSENPELSYYLGICYAKIKEYNNALLYLEQAVSQHWNMLLVYQCRMILSYIYAVTGRYQLAAYELEQLLKSGYESVQTHTTYSYVLFSQDKTEEALEHLQKALTLDPDNANALNSLGYIMAESDLDIATALNCCKAALEKKPDNPAYLDSMGWALFKGGRAEEAKQYLKKALELSSGNPVVASHMKEVLYETGDI